MPSSKKLYEVVVGIFCREGSVLMGCRDEGSNQKFWGYWEFPGGKVEPGENHTQALDREFQEELGCRVLNQKFFKTVEWEYPDKKIRLQFYFVKLSCDEPAKMHRNAHSDVKWFLLEEAAKEKTLPANEELLKELLLMKDQIPQFND